jgi:low temperature requirement protein LtrA
LLRSRQGPEPTTSTELFFDLVYIFSVTQLSRYLLRHPTWTGAFQTALLLALVWLVWIYTAWMTNWLHPDRGPVRTVLVLSMLGSLLLSATIPTAFENTGLIFAVTYAVLQVGRTTFSLWATRTQPALVGGFQKSLCWLSLSAALIVAGGFLDGYARALIWTAALAIEVTGLSIGFPVPGLGRTRPEDWGVEGGHLAERCRAFILIALGESILTTGSGFAERLDLPSLGAFVLAFSGSVALWAVYFVRSAEAGARVVANAREQTGRLSRAAFNYIHPVMVGGIILAASADERLLNHPAAPTDTSTAIFIFGGTATFLAGHGAYQAVLWGVVPTTRIIGAVILLVLIPLAGYLSTAAATATALAVTVGVIIADQVRDRPGSGQNGVPEFPEDPQP